MFKTMFGKVSPKQNTLFQTFIPGKNASLKINFLISQAKTYVVGTQKNHLIERVRRFF